MLSKLLSTCLAKHLEQFLKVYEISVFFWTLSKKFSARSVKTAFCFSGGTNGVNIFFSNIS